MGIQTDSTPLEEPKDHKHVQCVCFIQVDRNRKPGSRLGSQYRGGNFGYGHAKTALFELILENFGEAREKFDHYMANPGEVMSALKTGADKARPVAQSTLNRVRDKLGF